MIITSLIIVGAFLLFISLIDIYTHKIPAFLTTAMIFVIVIVSLNNNLSFGMIRLSFGVLALLFALMMYELNFIGGIADIKAIVLIGVLIPSINYFIAFMMLIMVIGTIYKIIWKLKTKDAKHTEIPFIPVFFIVYLIMILIGGVV